MAAFSHLPPELVEYVVTYLQQADICAFARTSKSLYALAVPILYRHVDLSVLSEDRLPRIDRFCLNIISDTRLASRVESLRLGQQPSKVVHEGARWLATDKHFDDDLMLHRAMQFLRNQFVITEEERIVEGIYKREYSAFAALILLVLPTLQHLEIAHSFSTSVLLVQVALSNLNNPDRPPSQALLNRLSSINKFSLNVNRLSGLVYPRTLVHSIFDSILNLPGITKLEFSLPDGQGHGMFGLPLHDPHARRGPLVAEIRPTMITTLVIRSTGTLLQILPSLLSCTPQLQSFTYDLFYNCNGLRVNDDRIIDLAAWSDLLQEVRATLQKLVFSVEYCHTDKYPFQQPSIGDKLYGYLDLTNFPQLHTLEAPFPFLTGDVDFSITTEIYPLLPPNLRHLSLRPDLSHAQALFPLDTSILPSGLTFQESEIEARHLMNARMDVSYMFHATLEFLNCAPGLDTISVWQPADASLSWFDGQVLDFATICRNKSVNGKIIQPMLLRWMNPEHWNLIKEITVFDRTAPARGLMEKFHREEWAGIPLGLASQYHLYALQAHKVRSRRSRQQSLDIVSPRH
ncbi:uncharacterized protein K460DRAFT_376398 [Cucurbitaria berberidis CBS 394.84]|uniref:F-box domain-containing protein n=1 Tax=Cucurbitaria berberidis CBS 394.84 TaxID=1168544 RepID=A0A9P4GG77_9PLEO|nr:uncharacterized protein K460DRAFT_376398 [Cucurbitaria berberidis CBS 394.84]KAF1844782.1 hypothetical protein K460DRAFT_376398 [Cucurbitaria berberidis CBS 394.84]